QLLALFVGEFRTSVHGHSSLARLVRNTTGWFSRNAFALAAGRGRLAHSLCRPPAVGRLRPRGLRRLFRAPRAESVTPGGWLPVFSFVDMSREGREGAWVVASVCRCLCLVGGGEF